MTPNEFKTAVKRIERQDLDGIPLISVAHTYQGKHPKLYKITPRWIWSIVTYFFPPKMDERNFETLSQALEIAKPGDDIIIFPK